MDKHYRRHLRNIRPQMEKLQPRILAKQDIANNGFIKAISVDIENTRGGKGNFIQFDRHGSSAGAVIIPITAEGKIIMVREFRMGPENWILSLPMGGCENDDEPVEWVVRRELQEETGYQAHHYINLGECYSCPSLSPIRAYRTLAIDCSASKQGSAHEANEFILEPEHYDLPQLRDLMHQGEIRCSETLATLAFLFSATRLMDDETARNCSGAFMGGVINETLSLQRLNPYTGKDEREQTQQWQQGADYVKNKIRP